MSWLDKFLDSIRNVQSAGTLLPNRDTLNFVGLTVADDPANRRTNVTSTALTAPTGTGFVHVTSGSVDGAARAVNLASADVTGLLPLVNLAHGTAAQILVTNVAGTAPVWATVVGDVSPTPVVAGALFVGGISGAGGLGGIVPLHCSALAFGEDESAPSLSQDDTPNDDGADLSVISQTGQQTGGDIRLISGTGVRTAGAVRATLGGGSGVNMIEAAEITTGRHVVALCQAAAGAGVSSTQIPGTGSDGVVFVFNCQSVPGGNPVGGVLLYATGGALVGKGTSGTITTIAPAEPHCPVCGSDFGHQWENERWGKLTVCMRCMAEELGERAWIRREPPVST